MLPLFHLLPPHSFRRVDLSSPPPPYPFFFPPPLPLFPGAFSIVELPSRSAACLPACLACAFARSPSYSLRPSVRPSVGRSSAGGRSGGCSLKVSGAPPPPLLRSSFERAPPSSRSHAREEWRIEGGRSRGKTGGGGKEEEEEGSREGIGPRKRRGKRRGTCFCGERVE